MHRIDGPGATTGHLFTEGDPTQGVPATTVTGAWLNAVQEEVAHVIEAAGITLDKPNNGQLHSAILALISANQQIGFVTGDVKLTMRTAADAGWVLCNDGTIGKTGSAATARANDDCQALFTLLWTNVANGFAPVSGGRGASAAADWAAGKTIGLTKMLGRALAVAGSGSGLSARQLGQTVGAETHQLTIAEMPSHSHPLTQAINGVGSTQMAFQGGSGAVAFSTSSTGGDGAHNNMQPTAFLNAMIKL